MHQAGYYAALPGNRFRCDLCPHQCLLTEGKPGQCKVRVVRNGKLVSENYGRLSAIATDPIEKKPLYHFYPGEKILSIGSVGCNMHCKNCQNENISQCIDIMADQLIHYSAKDIAEKAVKDPARLFAFTYNEPTIYYEFMYDVAELLNKRGIVCVMVTNGYIMPKPLKNIIPLISGFNVDLKFFQENIYRKMTGAGLKPVLNTLEQVKRSGQHLEITFLVIPGINDHPGEFKKMIDFIHENLGREQVFHLSRYFPRYKMNLPPTPIIKMLELRILAKEKLDFVYLGNTGPEIDSNTWCPSCGNLLIQRNYYTTTIVGMRDNTCKKCGTVIHGKFREQ
ncbi:MAG: AmmeMemoRadiSam system radical SAM enzyme [Bacteroidales bacterium]